MRLWLRLHGLVAMQPSLALLLLWQQLGLTVMRPSTVLLVPAVLLAMLMVPAVLLPSTVLHALLGMLHMPLAAKLAQLLQILHLGLL